MIFCSTCKKSNSNLYCCSKKEHFSAGFVVQFKFCKCWVGESFRLRFEIVPIACNRVLWSVSLPTGEFEPYPGSFKFQVILKEVAGLHSFRTSLRYPERSLIIHLLKYPMPISYDGYKVNNNNAFIFDI